MKYINRDQLKEIVPAWAADVSYLAAELDRQLYSWLGGAPIYPHRQLEFWFDVADGHVRLAVLGDDGIDLRGQLIIDDIVNPLGSPCQVLVPLNTVIDGFKPLGSHSVYCHGIQTDAALYYFGVTKQRWYARFSRHISDAKSGSPYVFHRALSQHAGKKMVHRLLDPALPYENAMQWEEKFVEISLYPKGMNMIPGGFAGIKYLASLGFRASNIKQRDALIERLSRMPSIKGRPNPLCAARWQNDQDYVNRIICGHGDRLTVEQVRQIRLLSNFGQKMEGIKDIAGVVNERQVKDVLSGKYYGRVA